MRIFKYELDVVDEQTIPMPGGAKLLHFDNQRETACVWALVDTGNELRGRELLMCGTGHPAPKHGEYVGTALLRSGLLVMHLFDGGWKK